MRFLSPKYLLLLILPLLYLFFSGIFFAYWPPFYTIGPDPVYIYLSTGMNIASGHTKIFYIDNPGIPVQCFCAVVIYIKHLFNHGIPLYQDVLLHPESYLYTLCVTIAIIYTLVTWATGYYVFKRTGNITVSLLFQLTPLICTHGVLITGRPSPESFYTIAGIFFMAYIYCTAIVAGTQSSGRVPFGYVLVYSIFTAFFISCKYICFPLIFLILFVLPTLRSRIQYLISMVVFLFIFMYPALAAWRSIMQWITNLATHTGHYGQGAQGFVNTSEYIPNLAKIFTEDKYFTILFILLIIALYSAFIKRKQMSKKTKIYASLLCGVGVSSLILILLVAKHYSFHYLIPIQLCYPLIIAGSYNIFKESYNIRLLHGKIPVVLFYIFTFCLAYSQLKTYFTYRPTPIPASTANFLNQYRDTPVIMSADFESSRIEPAISLGVAYTGDSRNQYWEYLGKIYPNSYQYRYPQEVIMHWDDVLYPPELIAKHPQMLVYFIQKDSATRNAILQNITVWGKDTLAHARRVFSLKQTDEYIYEIDGNSDAAKALLSKWKEVDFDLEKLTPDKSKFISTGGTDTASGTDLLSNKEHHSGNNSILMNWKNQYSLNYNIHALPGSIVVASIWRKSDDGNGSIVFTSRTDGDFYTSGQAATNSDTNGWKQIEYKCLVPSAIKDSTVFFYLYYYGHGYAYFDDLSVRVYSMKK